MGLLSYLPQPLLFLVAFAAAAFGLVVHNLAQAWLADRYGDPNPRRYGFLTLEPRVHLDPIGLLLLLLLGFGWPRFVPFRLYGRKEALVALAGPAGFLLASFVYLFLARLMPHGMGLFPVAQGLELAGFLMIGHAVVYLFPVPPLDGARVARALGGPEVRRLLAQIESWGPVGFILIFLVLSYTGVLGALERGVYGFFLRIFAVLGL